MEDYKKMPDLGKKIPPKMGGQIQYKEAIGPQKPPTLAEKIKGVIRDRLEAHQIKRKESRREPREREREPGGEREPKRRVSRVDRYEDGQIRETVYFSQNEQLPRRKKPKSRARPNRERWGMAGMGIGDFEPSNMGLGETLPGTGRKSKRRREPDWTDPSYIPPELKRFF